MRIGEGSVKVCPSIGGGTLEQCALWTKVGSEISDSMNAITCASSRHRHQLTTPRTHCPVERWHPEVELTVVLDVRCIPSRDLNLAVVAWAGVSTQFSVSIVSVKVVPEV